MDRSRIAPFALVAATVTTVAVSAFAVGAAITSDDDTGTAGGDVAAPQSTVAGATATDATAGDSPPQTATGRLEIDIVDFQFTPQDAVVKPGTEVVWTNSDPEHSIVSTGDPAFDDSPSTLSRGDSHSYVFTEPGVYTYICGIHPATMSGVITVEE